MINEAIKNIYVEQVLIYEIDQICLSFGLKFRQFDNFFCSCITETQMWGFLKGLDIPKSYRAEEFVFLEFFFCFRLRL